MLPITMKKVSLLVFPSKNADIREPNIMLELDMLDCTPYNTFFVSSVAHSFRYIEFPIVYIAPPIPRTIDTTIINPTMKLFENATLSLSGDLALRVGISIETMKRK